MIFVSPKACAHFEKSLSLHEWQWYRIFYNYYFISAFLTIYWTNLLVFCTLLTSHVDPLITGFVKVTVTPLSLWSGVTICFSLTWNVSFTLTLFCSVFLFLGDSAKFFPASSLSAFHLGSRQNGNGVVLKDAPVCSLLPEKDLARCFR